MRVLLWGLYFQTVNPDVRESGNGELYHEFKPGCTRLFFNVRTNEWWFATGPGYDGASLENLADERTFALWLAFRLEAML